MSDRAQLNRLEREISELRQDVRNVLRYCAYLPLIYKKEFEQMASVTELAQQIAKDAKDNDDAFAALNAADEARATRLKTAIEALKAAGTTDQATLDQLAAVHDSLTGTSGKMIAAAALANTDASGDVPADVAATVPAA